MHAEDKPVENAITEHAYRIFAARAEGKGLSSATDADLSKYVALHGILLRMSELKLWAIHCGGRQAPTCRQSIRVAFGSVSAICGTESPSFVIQTCRHTRDTGDYSLQGLSTRRL